MSGPLDLYANAYGHFDSAAEAAVRLFAYGEDIGQTSWTTTAEWLGFADALGIGPGRDVLDVGSGSGGPAAHLAASRGCRVTGVDVSEPGVANGRRLAEARGLAGRLHFERVDASRPLPFPDESFDAIVANDTVCHLAARAAAIADWHRLLRPGGRLLVTDALVATGLITNEELAVRTSIGFYVMAPPGENERLVAAAGFALLAVEDLTASVAAVARRRRDARQRHRAELVALEGEPTFEGLQRYLACAIRLAEERRLSRFSYLAEKPRSLHSRVGRDPV